MLTRVLWIAIWLFAATEGAAAQDLRAQQARLDSMLRAEASAGDRRMAFDSTEIDAGTMSEDDTPRGYTFRWRNLTGKPLVITRVQTTCGCTRAEYPKSPVAAGQESGIVVKYNPQGRPGSFRRKIYVYTQLSKTQPTAVLTLSGNVVSTHAPSRDYPDAMGALRLKRTEITIDPYTRAVERIECLNDGAEPLHIAADERMLPPWLKVWCDKEEIAPGTTADIVVEFDPGLVNGVLPQSQPVLMEGLDLPPGQRMLHIRYVEK